MRQDLDSFQRVLQHVLQRVAVCCSVLLTDVADTHIVNETRPGPICATEHLQYAVSLALLLVLLIIFEMNHVTHIK